MWLKTEIIGNLDKYMNFFYFCSYRDVRGPSCLKWARVDGVAFITIIQTKIRLLNCFIRCALCLQCVNVWVLLIAYTEVSIAHTRVHSAHCILNFMRYRNFILKTSYSHPSEPGIETHFQKQTNKMSQSTTSECLLPDLSWKVSEVDLFV